MKGPNREFDEENRSRVKTLLRAVIRRCAPPGSVYDNQAFKTGGDEYKLVGVVRALRDDYAADRLKTYRELLNSELFSDFLAMAEYLLNDENLKQPSAVLAGGVLEEHIRKLCGKYNVPTAENGIPKKAERMNQDLAKASVYGMNDQKQVTAWLGIRNSAAHMKHSEYDAKQVQQLISGVRDFIPRFPA